MPPYSRTIFALLICGQFLLKAHAIPDAELWSYWQPAETSVTTPINHDRWQQLLDRYVSTPDDRINRFAYHKVTAADRSVLESYLQALAELDPRSYSEAEQMAYWINLYNALTVQIVLDHPNKNTILRMRNGLFSIGPWNDSRIEIAGQSLTLNDIENRILRPIWRDRRIHFAVNCASLGCPDLSHSAFTGANLETLLTSAEQAFINHPRGVRFNRGGELILSSIFDWYADDFTENRAQLLAYLAEHHATAAERLPTYEGRIRYDYDWSLNRE